MKKQIPLISLVIISFCIVLFFYGKVLISPNSYLFNTDGDAIKNYYTYYYHITNDSSYINFQGMNYPYGEHYLYTDCHPVFSNIFQFLGNYFKNIHNYCIGFINWLMIFSIFLTSILLYFILLEFKIQKWIAVFFSIGITLLQPQIFRLFGHLALSYSICIPLTWLLLIKYYKSNNKLLYIVILFLNNLFWLFIHAYLGVIIIFFEAIVLLIITLFNRLERKKYISYFSFFITILIPLLFFKLFIFFTDNHIGRTNNPSGFFLYNAEPDDILIPHHAPLRPLFDKINGLHINLQWEAWGYIGFIFSIILIYILLFFLIQIFRKRKNLIYQKYFENSFLNISLLSAIVVLLFAFGLPFKLFRESIDYFNTVKQFRATGRFDWVFFYVFSVFSVYVVNQLFLYLKSKNKNIIAYILLFFSISFTIIEGIYYHFDVSSSICKSKNLFSKDNLDNNFKNALSKIDFNNYQAIIPLPFYSNGSECFSRPINNSIMRISMVFSAITNTPIVGANLTRTSAFESKKSIQLISPSFYPKMIKNDIKSNKPFIIIKSNDEITEYENDILSKSNLLFKTDSFSIFNITKQKLFENMAKHEYEKFNNIAITLFNKNGFLVTDTNTFMYYNDFEYQKSNKCFRGNGAYYGEKKGKNIFAQFNPNTFLQDKEYVVSAWMYNAGNEALNGWLRFMVEEFDEKSNKWFETIILPEQSEVIYGDWSLIELKFKVVSSKNKIFIVSKGKDNENQKLCLDDLLIRENTEMVYKVFSYNNMQILFKNNHEIKFLK